MKNNATNTDITIYDDGFAINGGLTGSTLSVFGGEVSMTGSSSSYIYTFPSQSGTLALTTDNTAGSVNVILDGGGSAIPQDTKVDLEWRFSATITGWSIMADQQGSIVVDVWEAAFASFPPTVANTVTGSEKPTLSNATTNQDTSLTTWTSSIQAGDIWRINVDSATTVTRVTVSFHYTRTS